MDLWQYIRPDNPVSSWVVSILIIGFILWTAALLTKFGLVLAQRGQMSRLRNVKFLKDSLDKHIEERSRPAGDFNNALNGPTITEAKLVDRKPGNDPEKIFQQFCKAASVKGKSVLARHIRTIFNAGWEDSQIQSDTLTNNTSNRLFRFNTFLRSTLSLFIIIGLLGTLFGLALSLAQLSPLIAGKLPQANNALALDLGNLLARLQGAFAPSIWGVFFTIMGVFFLSAYAYFCQYVRDYLEYLTLTVWIPKLYPSSLQRQLIGLAQTEELIQKNRENIERGAAFVNDIQSSVGELRGSIGSASRTLITLSKSSAQINKFADKFHEAVEKLTPFQAELSTLYQQMLRDSQSFQTSVERSVEGAAALQEKAESTLVKQNERIEEVFHTLRSYEDSYIRARQDIDTKLQTVLDEARKAYKDIGERNREISAAIKDSLSDPLRKDLTTKLGDIQTVLSEKLESILNRFGTFDTPIKQSAEEIARIASTIDNRATELTNSLRHEYIEQNEKNKEQLDKLEGLNRQLVEFLNQLNEVSKTQGGSTVTLGNAMGALTQNLNLMNDNLKALRQSISTSDGTGKMADITRLERQISDNFNKIFRGLDRLGGIPAGRYSPTVTAPVGESTFEGRRNTTEAPSPERLTRVEGKLPANDNAMAVGLIATTPQEKNKKAVSPEPDDEEFKPQRSDVISAPDNQLKIDPVSAAREEPTIISWHGSSEQPDKGLMSKLSSGVRYIAASVRKKFTRR